MTWCFVKQDEKILTDKSKNMGFETRKYICGNV